MRVLGVNGYIVVFTATCLLAIHVGTSCLPKIVTCNCGNLTTVDINVKRCLKVGSWGMECKSCKRYRKSQLCTKYKRCHQCGHHENGGCINCWKGWYGAFCEKECRCKNGGSCNHHGDCQCLPSYIGAYCQTKILKDCGSPNIPVYGEVILSNTTEGSIASFKCPPNFLLIGQINQTCLSTGQWSGKAPICEYSCPVPKASSHLVMKLVPFRHMFDDYVSNIELIRQANFRCEDGYELQGRQLLHCLPDGTWDSTQPTCVRKCKPPPRVRDGEIVESNSFVLEGDTIHYRCHNNFRMEGSTELTCTNGSWDSASPLCVPEIRCDELYLEEHKGHIYYSDDDRMAGSEAILQCYTGFINTSPDGYRVCGEDGFWRDKELDCEEIEEEIACDEPVDPMNGGKDSIFDGQYYEYWCYEGYYLLGKTQTHCVDGEWTSEVPECVSRTTCNVVEMPHGCSVCYGYDCSKRGHTSADCVVETGGLDLPDGVFLVGTVMEFRYDRTLYQLAGSRRRVCQSDGVWSGRQTTCMPTCGRRSITRRLEIKPRIRMGSQTNEGEWPWQIGIIWVHDRGMSFQCGGSLISEELILTAAHCVASGKQVKRVNKIKVHAGTFDLRGQTGKLLEVKRIIVHDNYDPMTHDSDIALIQLREKLKLSTTIRPVCIPDAVEVEDNIINDTILDDPLVPAIRNLTDVEGVVIGWGITENGSFPNILKKTNVKIADQDVCLEYHEQMNITDSMLCAVGSNPTQADACSGDSGGPLLVQDESGRWTVVGIVSFGLHNCSMSAEERYGVYTRVERFIPWIQDHL